MKFKKQIIVILSILLLVSNVGLSFNVHYCGDKIASISLKSDISSQGTNKGCCKESTSKKYNCCKDRAFYFQQKADNFIVKSFAFHLDYSFILEEWNPIVFSSVSHFKNSQIATYCCEANAPPLYKLYGQYVFYV